MRLGVDLCRVSRFCFLSSSSPTYSPYSWRPWNKSVTVVMIIGSNKWTRIFERYLDCCGCRVNWHSTLVPTIWLAVIGMDTRRLRLSRGGYICKTRQLKRLMTCSLSLLDSRDSYSDNSCFWQHISPAKHFILACGVYTGSVHTLFQPIRSKISEPKHVSSNKCVHTQRLIDPEDAGDLGSLPRSW